MLRRNCIDVQYNEKLSEEHYHLLMSKTNFITRNDQMHEVTPIRWLNPNVINAAETIEGVIVRKWETEFHKRLLQTKNYYYNRKFKFNKEDKLPSIEESLKSFMEFLKNEGYDPTKKVKIYTWW